MAARSSRCRASAFIAWSAARPLRASVAEIPSVVRVSLARKLASWLLMFGPPASTSAAVPRLMPDSSASLVTASRNHGGGPCAASAAVTASMRFRPPQVTRVSVLIFPSATGPN
ncbi:hypothetical protein GCM10009558_101010 [Virgisporangium aurantiacum]